MKVKRNLDSCVDSKLNSRGICILLVVSWFILTQNLSNTKLRANGNHSDVGNGGTMVVCYDSLQGKRDKDITDIVSVRLTDYYIAEDQNQWRMNLVSRQGDYLAQLDQIIDLVRRFDPVRSQGYQTERENLANLITNNEKQVFVDGIRLSPVSFADFHPLPLLDLRCQIELAAIRRVVYQNESEYLIDKTLWYWASDYDKAGLLSHEIVFKDAIGDGNFNPGDTIFFNAFISSQRFQQMSSSIDYQHLLRKVSFDRWLMRPRSFSPFRPQRISAMQKLPPFLNFYQNPTSVIKTLDIPLSEISVNFTDLPSSGSITNASSLWCDRQWSHNQLGMAYRWLSNTPSPGIGDWQKEVIELYNNDKEKIESFIAGLSPAEKLDIYLGRFGLEDTKLNFPFTKSEQQKNPYFEQRKHPDFLWPDDSRNDYSIWNLPDWYGVSEGWSLATLREPEPGDKIVLTNHELDESKQYKVTFYKRDMKALLARAWAWDQINEHAAVVGRRNKDIWQFTDVHSLSPSEKFDLVTSGRNDSNDNSVVDPKNSDPKFEKPLDKPIKRPLQKKSWEQMFQENMIRTMSWASAVYDEPSANDNSVLIDGASRSSAEIKQFLMYTLGLSGGIDTVSFHILLGNLVGRFGESLVVDIDTTKRVLPLPIVGYNQKALDMGGRAHSIHDYQSLIRRIQSVDYYKAYMKNLGGKSYYFKAPLSKEAKYIVALKVNLVMFDIKCRKSEGLSDSNYSNNYLTFELKYILGLDQDLNIVDGKWLNFNMPDFAFIAKKKPQSNPLFPYGLIQEIVQASLR